MRIANIMLGRRRGGIEQAFLDYNEALQLAGHEVLAITHPQALINAELTQDIFHTTLPNAGSWDPIAVFRLKRLLRDFQPEASICHGNRALHLTHKAQKYAGLRIGITHNYNLKHFNKLDFAFATTKDLRHTAIKLGMTKNNIALIPNMVRTVESNHRKTPIEEDVIIIGAMGRFVAKKGFDQLLYAAAKIKILTRIPFRIILGGEGEEKAALQRLCKELKLEDIVDFVGWVEDKNAFYSQCHLFCLPSLHEPFGIVTLEAMAHGVPVVAYDSEGPHEIFMTHPEAGLRVKLGDSGALAEALTRLINNPAQRKFMADQALKAIQHDYALPVVSEKIDAVLKANIH